MFSGGVAWFSSEAMHWRRQASKLGASSDATCSQTGNQSNVRAGGGARSTHSCGGQGRGWVRGFVELLVQAEEGALRKLGALGQVVDFFLVRLEEAHKQLRLLGSTRLSEVCEVIIERGVTSILI